MLVSAQCLVVETEHRLHVEMLCEVIGVCWSWGALCLCQWCWCSWFLKTRPGDSRPLSGTCTNPSSTRYYCCSSHYWLGQTCSLSCECLSPSCVYLCVCVCVCVGWRERGWCGVDRTVWVLWASQEGLCSGGHRGGSTLRQHHPQEGSSSTRGLVPISLHRLFRVLCDCRY